MGDQIFKHYVTGEGVSIHLDEVDRLINSMCTGEDSRIQALADAVEQVKDALAMFVEEVREAQRDW